MREEKYINPFTDFGFKKLFGEEISKDNKLQNEVFIKAFEIAEISKFDRKQLEEYEQSLKYYRDIKNVVDTSFEEGIEEGKKTREIEIAKNAKNEGLPIEVIIKLTGLSKEEIENLE